MSEPSRPADPVLSFSHEPSLQPAPVNPQPVPIDQYRPPTNAAPDRYQDPHQFMQNPTPPANATPSQSSNNTPSEPPAPANQPTASNQPNLSTIPGLVKPEPEEDLLIWQAMSRPHKKRQRQYFMTIAIFVVLIGAILFFLSQFLLVGVVLAVAFLAYVLEVVPPTTVTHKITTYGIRVEGTLYYWDELGRFWFTHKYGLPLLHLEIARFPGRATLLLGDLTEEDMRQILSAGLLEQKPPETFFEKAADRLQKLIPLENDQPAT